MRAERDEALHPARGSWKHYRGREGTIVVVNDEQRAGRVFHREYGVAWHPVTFNDDGSVTRQGSDTTWFLPHELVVLSTPN